MASGKQVKLPTWKVLSCDSTGATRCLAVRQRRWLGRRWRAWERSVRSLLIWGAFICLALFYLVSAILGGPPHTCWLQLFVRLACEQSCLQGIQGHLPEQGPQGSSSLAACYGLSLRAQIPIAAVQGLLAVDVLDKNPVMHFILHAPVLDSVITAILPSASPNPDINP